MARAKQTKKDKRDESIVMRHGKESSHKQSMKDRRDEMMKMKKCPKKGR